jgi:CRISPR/Cas system-associated exonuclease Cas4 (RecB family)
MIVEQIMKYYESRLKVYPIHSNRASELGNKCLRYHVLSRTRWQEKTVHDATLEMIFALGNDFERIALRELDAAGVRVIEQQKPFSWPEYQITGHVDGLIEAEDKKYYPLEIKSTSPFMFDSIKTLHDLTRSRYPYMRKYPTQLNLYCLMAGIDKGVFLFKNKSTGAYKEIWMPLDYQLGEETLKRAEKINEHIKAGTTPERTADETWCERCAFLHICLPERIGDEVKVVDTDEAGLLINRIREIKPLASEYTGLTQRLKALLEDMRASKLLCGDYFIERRWRKMTRYDVPEDVKGQYAKDSGFWISEITDARTGEKI